MINKFYDLRVWNKSYELILEIYKISNNFPKSEVFSLSNQIRRAAVSVSANIAEGFKRNSLREKIHFYSISLGSLSEVESHLLISRGLIYLNEETFLLLKKKITEIEALLAALIRKLRTKILR